MAVLRSREVLRSYLGPENTYFGTFRALIKSLQANMCYICVQWEQNIDYLIKISQHNYVLVT
jgi:hypothetical protein